MSKKFSPAAGKDFILSNNSKNYNYNNSAANNIDDQVFNPTRINVFLDIAENDLIPKLTKYIGLNGGVYNISFVTINNLFYFFRNHLLF